MYANQPIVLSKVTSQTQLFQARRHEDMLETLLRMQLITAPQQPRLRAQLKGPRGKQVFKALQAALRKAKEAAKASFHEQGLSFD